MDDQDAIRDLERDVKAHESAAARLEEDARHRRLMASRARAGLEYLRKQRGT